MNQSSQIDTRALVLTSRAYREHVELLYPLYIHSREFRADPRKLLFIQSELAEVLKFYQEKRRQFRNENSDLDAALAKRLIKVVQDIADGIAWRSLRYHRLLIQQLASKPKTGYLDETFINDFNVAAQIIDEDGELVIVNDLTRVLRYGDLTIVDDSDVVIVENKGGRASKRDRRAKRQKRNLKQLTDFYNTGWRITEGRRELLTRLDIPMRTHLPEVGDVVDSAVQDGYAQSQVSDCLIIEAFATRQGFQRKGPRPFENREYVFRFHNLQPFDIAATRHAPYTIYPFDDKTCFDLVTGDIFLVSYLDMQALQSRFAQSNLALSFPNDMQTLSSYTQAHIRERKKMMSQLRFAVKDNQLPNQLLFDIDLLGLVYMEFLQVDTFINVTRQIMREMSPNDQEHIRIYIGFDNEMDLWD